MSAGNLVTPEWLAQHLSEANIVIADCRFDLANPQAGRLQHQQGHIPRAFHLDLDADLSAPKQSHGGRHPLPDLAVFTQKLGSLGIDHDVTVVAYDDQRGSMAAARFWWMLRFLGHDRAKVLDGGWSAWRTAGYSVTTEVYPATPRAFVPRIRREMLIEIEELRRRLRAGPESVIDSRARERYRGEVEPLDPVAGHIPRAANIPWGESVDDAGRLKSPDVLRKLFEPVTRGAREPIFYCGSGVTACVNLLAMEEAGIKGALLYLGGWSDWCSFPDNPVATEKETDR